MTRRSLCGQFLLAAALLILCAGGSGCTLLKSGLSLFGSDPPAPTMAADTPAIGLRFHSLGGEVQRVKIPYRDGMVVHDALEQAEAFKHFKTMSIALRRVVPESKKLAKMQVELEAGQRSVALGSDYALFERDILDITEEQSGWGSDTLRSALGPLGSVLLPE
ncbi:MAG: hypothetical protein CMJ59_04030 [Planctomycetaceae bacterium]|nr:hypothetical protein [Planctomycetaceae bacterium]